MAKRQFTPNVNTRSIIDVLIINLGSIGKTATL